MLFSGLLIAEILLMVFADRDVVDDCGWCTCSLLRKQKNREMS